nr:uncharacterized protein LOC109149355 [Ipomoea trifida]
MEGETHSGSDQKPNMKTEEDDETKAVQVSLAKLFAIQNAEETHLIIPSCDCISIRSSSTTSTQSFAFPMQVIIFPNNPFHFPIFIHVLWLNSIAFVSGS